MTEVLDHEMKEKITRELVDIEELANEMAEDARQFRLVVKNATSSADLKDAMNKYEKGAQEVMYCLHLDLEIIEVAEADLYPFKEGN
jgi:hypothetical protein